MDRVVSFIPIKLQNQRLPGKNLMELEGRPLCEHLFDTICQVDEIAEKYVYCSDEKIQEYMPPEMVFLKRDARLDGFQVKGLEIIESFVGDVDADVYVLAHVTQPFTRAESIRAALGKVLREGYDSAFSCMEIQDYCWYGGKPLNYDMGDIATTQNLEPVYVETGAFYIFRREVFARLRQRIGENPFPYIVDHFEAVDIDTPEDFEYARAVASYLSGRRG